MLRQITIMKLHRTVLALVALSTWCHAWTLGGPPLENEGKGLLERRSTKTIEIPIFTGLIYMYKHMFMNVTVGTPGQPLTMGLATWWGDSQISNSSDAWSLGLVNFNPTSSSTFEPDSGTSFNDTNGDGPGVWYSGEYCHDTLSIAGNDFENFTFSFIENGAEISDYFIGLGDKVDEAVIQTGDEFASSQPTLLTYAVSKGLIQTTAYSIYFDKPNETFPSGQLLLGGVDAGKFEGGLETLATTVVTSTNTSEYEHALAVSMNSLSFSPNGDLSNQHSLGPFQPFLVHPGVYSMWLPPQVATAVWTAFGATYDTTIDPVKAFPIVPCSYLTNTSTLNLHLNSNIVIAVPMSDLTVRNGTGVNDELGEFANVCRLDILAAISLDKTTSFNGIGTAALKYMYTVYDLQNNEISIGLRGTAAGTSNVMEIGPDGVSALHLSASPTPQAKSHALAIGLGVGLSLLFVLVTGIVVGLLLFRRRRRQAAAGQAPKSSSANGNEAPEKAPNAPLPELGSTRLPTVSPNNAAELQTTSYEPEETRHEAPGSTVRYSELPGISAFHPPESPQMLNSQNQQHSPRP
ncbi:acid protease [Stipitochalara longipes BDJ]|nr:acid protease [Stipitochalara longipes BDJ]